MIRGKAFLPEKIIEVLQPYISESRVERLGDVVDGRTRSLVTVVEGISNYGNVSAVMRTAEALGFFEVHVITGAQPYKHSRRTSQGAEKWLDVQVWEKPEDCIEALRKRGFRVAVTDAGPDSVPLSALDFTRPTAIILGNEVDGVSATVRERADVVCRIDMNGFVESYNISVAAALILYHGYQNRIEVLGRNGDLSSDEHRVLTAQYYLRAIQHAEEILLEEHRRSLRDT